MRKVKRRSVQTNSLQLRVGCLDLMFLYAPVTSCGSLGDEGGLKIKNKDGKNFNPITLQAETKKKKPEHP